jgi:murein endopeptidase
MGKVRLDTLLAQRGLFDSRARAAASVMAGEVRVGEAGERAAKPGQLVARDVALSVDERYGGLGHASHQNGLDADVFYPRKDGRPRSAWRPGQVDRTLAQDLVDRFVAAGAEKVFVGPRLGLRGPPRVVQPVTHHDDHLHVRIPELPVPGGA